MSNINLSKVIKVGYKSQNKQQKNMKKYGYKLDKDLSNDNQQVYYNKNQNKLLYNVSGTHNLKDVGTDVYLALGKLKNTNRYKEADETLKKAKAKYNINKATITGHSLGASIAQGISKPEDQEYSLNAGYTIGQKTKANNQHNYRTQGDVVSLLGTGSKNLKTIGKKDNTSVLSSFAQGGLYGVVNNLLKSHKPETIKKEKIFV
jgi:hypothetical protein